MTKIAIIGANGQLGTELCRQFGEAAVGLARPEFDLTNAGAAGDRLTSLRPEVIINAAAYTAVDRAEDEPARCQQVNTDAVRMLADVACRLNCLLVQISTDYVFEQRQATTPHSETDVPPPPEGVYARTKLAGERAAAAWDKHLIIRTCGLYSAAASGPVRGRNFADTMLSLGRERERLTVVNDQFCSPTYVPHLTRAIRWLIESGGRGIFHVTNSGETTWCQFARELFRIAAMPVLVEPITTAQYAARAPRPSYSVLDTSRFNRITGREMPSWRQGLAEYWHRLEGAEK